MVFPSLDEEDKLWKQGFSLVCGLDEVGKGSFAGPVVVGAVIFPKDVILPKDLADSKLLTPKKREELSKEIKEIALEWKIAEGSVEIINQVGIGKATGLAFKQAVDSLNSWDYCLIDAFYIDGLDKLKQKPIKNGDKICASISAASIIAKVYRDDLMVKLGGEYPNYNFAKHKGYGTKEHQQAIKKYGLCSLHRTSFDLEKFL